MLEKPHFLILLSNILSASLLLEEFEENKFLKSFMNLGLCIETEVQFLLDRSKQLKEFLSKTTYYHSFRLLSK